MEGQGPESKKWTRIVISCVLLAASALLLIASREADGFAEWYSSHVYPLLQGSIGRVCGMAPFSVAELLCLTLPVILAADIIANRKKLKRLFAHILMAVSILAFLYSAGCGVNYYRDPFVSAQQTGQMEISQALLEDFCEYAVEQLVLSSEAAAGSGFSYPENREIADTAVTAMEKLGQNDERLGGYYPRPKMFRILSPLFSMMGVSGIYSPFTIEANVNGEMEGMEMPFTACHELSHLKGFMDEGEANYIGWLACIGSDDPAFNRSGWLIAWSYAGTSLYRADPERFEEILAMLPQDAIEELRSNHEFWESKENRASEIQDDLNDAYLKSNGQEEGVASYGKLTTMMLNWYTQNRG